MNLVDTQIRPSPKAAKRPRGRPAKVPEQRHPHLVCASLTEAQYARLKEAPGKSDADKVRSLVEGMAPVRLT